MARRGNGAEEGSGAALQYLDGRLGQGTAGALEGPPAHLRLDPLDPLAADRIDDPHRGIHYLGPDAVAADAGEANRRRGRVVRGSGVTGRAYPAARRRFVCFDQARRPRSSTARPH